MPDTSVAQPTGTGLRRVLHHSSLYLIGNVASRLVAFLAIPIYSRFLTPAEYGLLELIELSTQTVAIAFGLQAIGTAMTRLFHDQPSAEAERSVVSTALIGAAILGAVVTLFGVWGAGAISRAVFQTGEWTSLLQAAFIAMFFASQVELILVYERMRDNARFYLAYSLITLGVTLSLNILFIGVLGAGVWGFVTSKIIVSVVGAGFLMWRQRRGIGWDWKGAHVPALVQLGAPLILSGLAYFAIHFSDRFFLTSSVSLEELGRYALAYRFALMVNVLVGDSFAKSWNVSVYRHTADADWRAQFARVCAYFTFILCATGVAVALFGPELLRVMVPATFYPPVLLLPILVLAYVVRDVADFFRSLLLINRRSSWIGQIAVGAALLNLLANLALIPPYGVHGAAWATLATWTAYLAAHWIAAQREHRLPIRIAPYAMLLGLMVAVWAAATASRVSGFLLQVLLDGLWLGLFIGVGAALFLSPADRGLAAGALGRWLARLLISDAPRSGDPDRRLLMLAYYYPPENEIGAERPGRFARILRQMGLPVTVVTAAHIPAANDAVTLRVPGPGGGLVRDRAMGWALGIVQRVALPYNDRLSWLPHACRAATAAATPGTVLMSTHPPIVTHLAALALHWRTGLPWIADFRDPHWGNPCRPSYRAGLMDPAVERLVVRHATAVIANTDAAAAVLAARYPDMVEKINTIWNGVDPADPVMALPASDRVRQTISHVGSLYGSRTPDVFAASLIRLIRGGDLQAASIEFRQVGPADPNCLDLGHPAYHTLAAAGCLHVIRQRVPKAQARYEALNADRLLLLDVNRTNPGLQVPAKLFDYVQACRPILAFTPDGSATARLLARSGVPHVCIDPGCLPAACDAAVLAFLRRPIPFIAPDPAFLAEFDADRQTADLAALIERVCADPA
ncbi:MAG: oligosaccharide flippase family protein [Gemmatimonadaceae bacterium]|nr:oligosaccharide flippase family protein [Acetobacteraceae bacterium]